MILIFQTLLVLCFLFLLGVSVKNIRLVLLSTGGLIVLSISMVKEIWKMGKELK